MIVGTSALIADREQRPSACFSWKPLITDASCDPDHVGTSTGTNTRISCDFSKCKRNSHEYTAYLFASSCDRSNRTPPWWRASCWTTAEDTCWTTAVAVCWRSNWCTRRLFLTDTATLS